MLLTQEIYDQINLKKMRKSINIEYLRFDTLKKVISNQIGRAHV